MNEENNQNETSENIERFGRADYSFQWIIKKLNPGEPVFLIRAQDIFFGAMLEIYAALVQAGGGDLHLVNLAIQHANRARSWQRANEPKSPDLEIEFDEDIPFDEVEAGAANRTTNRFLVLRHLIGLRGLEKDELLRRCGISDKDLNIALIGLNERGINGSWIGNIENFYFLESFEQRQSRRDMNQDFGEYKRDYELLSNFIANDFEGDPILRSTDRAGNEMIGIESPAQMAIRLLKEFSSAPADAEAVENYEARQNAEIETPAPNSLAKENAGREIENDDFAAAIGISFCVKDGFVYLQGEKHYAASNVESSLWQQLRHSYGFEADGTCNALHAAQIERELIQEDDFIDQDKLDLETLAFSIRNNERTLSPDSRERMIIDAVRCAEGALSYDEVEKLNDHDLAGEYLGALRDYVNSQI